MPRKRVIDIINKYGLYVSRNNNKLKIMRSNMPDYKPHELARDLVKMAYDIEPQITVSTAETLQLKKCE